MKSIGRFCRKYGWMILLGVGVVLAVLWNILRGRGGQARIDDVIVSPKPTFVEKARKEVEKVHLEAEVEKAKVQAISQTQVNKIEEIEEKAKEDPKQARKELAAFLAKSL